jgi:hypothetical protein
MKIKSLILDGKKLTNQHDIIQKLREFEFFWLIDSELNNAEIEIKNKTIIWHDGIFLSGQWHYGIFKNGKFFGHFENGIWENGDFKGTGNPL